ncbi:ectopic P granules protein 5 homolog isoform X2 [Mya arenaria]|uniref:ectopic P granules protein 5 homolog isoform X2 n=1 Tax=Mya arenaria TaxID=6604 RepID=UPI0022E40A4B|nr:ectopic P granules protein 5 homolog isoform X2 [Mya arenaria]
MIIKKMAEVLQEKRKKKIKKKRSENEDIAEGIPDIPDFADLLKDVTESPDIKTKPKETVKPAVTVVTEANKADVAEGSAKISDNASSKVLTAETNDNDTAFTAENTQEEENENDKESEEKTECEETNDIGKEVENQNDVTATSPLVECSGETCVDVLMKNKNEDAVGENIEPEEVEREQPNPEPDINTERISGVHEEQPACKLYPDISEQLEQFMKEEQQIHILDVPITETNVDELKDDAQLESPSETQPVETYNPRIIDASAPPPSVKEHQPSEQKITDTQSREIISAPPFVESRPLAPHYEDTGQAHQHVAPRVQRQDEIQPLTSEQLKSLYYNVKLENNEAYIDKFIQREMKQEKHEFYEILLNYQRARRHLLDCEATIQTYQEEYTKNQADVWITETCTTNIKGTCGDGYKCQGSHLYESAKLDINALSCMTMALKNIQETIQNELSLHSYSAQLSRLQVESYIHDLFANSPDLMDIPKNLPVSGCDHQSRNVRHQVEKLLDCISVLFVFHRQPIEDEEMVKNLQIWTERLVAPLLRVGFFEDHLFILNHIMRCPSGIGTWASMYIQAPPIPSNTDPQEGPLMFGNTQLDHMIAALSTVLIPTSYRNEFMCQMQKLVQTGRDNKNISWVLVDEDGDEDDDPQNSWLYLHENDVVAILRQLSLAAIYRHVFFIDPAQQPNSFTYDIGLTSESTMYRVFAFSTCLVQILGTGLRTYSMARFKQLNKRLGRMIRQCVQLVTDHWQNFQSSNKGVLTGHALQKLQVEYDAFFLRAVNLIHMSHRLGSWQYIADMPFNSISKGTMWRILWLLHQDGSHDQSHDTTFIPPAGECISFVKDIDCRSQLSDILQRVPPTEGVYLLNAMTNMTQCCTSADVSFIESVTLAVFEVSFVCTETRDFCSKMGRELLGAVVTCHPFMLSVLTQHVNEYLDKLGQMGIYLYKGLPMETWLPTDQDLTVVRQWLLSTALGSPANQMAQQILASINWGTTQRGNRLMVPWPLHRQVAVLVVEAYQTFIHGKHLGSMIMEGVKQMSAAVQQYQTAEQEFHSWCWTLLLKLSLHQTSLPENDRHQSSQPGAIPDFSDDSLMPLVKGVREKNPTACFVVLLMTKVGHGLTEFISEGLAMLDMLMEQGLPTPTISAIYFTMFLFVDQQKYILDNVKFQEVLLSILRADESYFKVVKGLLSYDFPGPITKLLTSMILSHIKAGGDVGGEGMVQVLEMWTQLFFNLPNWHSDRNSCYVMDNLIKVAFTSKPALEKVQQIFTEQYKNYCNREKSQGMVTSFVNWVTSGVTLPTYLDKSSCGEFSWLTYMILWVEGSFELETKLWPTIQEELLANPKAGTEQCLKKSINKLKLEQAPVWARLNIIRLAQQALDMPKEHPVAVLTWQRFFGLFLGRLNMTQAPSPQKATVGERFFSSLGYTSYVKKMKKRLGETADHYMKLAAEVVDSDDEEALSKKELHSRLSKMYHTFQFWVEEPMLHDAALYLPSLPVQCQPDRLVAVFQNDLKPWMELVDLKGVSSDVNTMTTEWKSNSVTPQTPKKKGRKGNEPRHSGANDILSRLSRLEEPLPPPSIHPMKSPVPEMSRSVLENKGSLLHLLNADLSTLVDYAGNHATHMAELKRLDDIYVDKITELFKNVRQQVTISLKCTSMINPLHKCSKPGAAVAWIEEKWNDRNQQRQADENRGDYKQRIIACKVHFSNKSIVAAIHTENAITMLVKIYRASTDDTQRDMLSSIGCSLFFRLGEVITDSVLDYPPTKQFFSSCIDILGKEFVQSQSSQSEPVLKLSLDRPEIGGMFAPHFKPNLSPRAFVPMYGTLVQQIRSEREGSVRERGNSGGVNLQVVAMLLTKFDVLAWLEQCGPSRQEVKKLIENLSLAFMACGPSPQDGYDTLFHLYLNHERKILHFRFPLYLNEVLAALLQGSSVQQINVECWDVLLSSCFHGEGSAGQDQHYPDVFTVLSLDEIQNLMCWLGHEFMQLRVNLKQGSTYNLYTKWNHYVPYLARLLRDLAKCLLDKMLPNITDAPVNEGLDKVWKSVVESYAPWLQTVTVQKVASLPWLTNDREVASHMVQSLAHFVGYAHYKTQDIQQMFYNDFLSLLWLYFAIELCKADSASEVVSLMNLEFSKLPWKQLMPNIHVLDTMARLRETGCSMGFNLVCDILALINWPQVTSFYENHANMEVRTRFQGAYFLLLIQAFTENKHIESPEVESILNTATSSKWEFLSADDFKKACGWLLQSCDPKCLLQSRTSPDGIGFRQLESAAGFNTEVSTCLTDVWIVKRLSYLHAVTSLVCQLTYLPDIDPDTVSKIVINLITEVETVESAVPDTRLQYEESVDMMKEVLSLLNNSNPDNRGAEVIMVAILDWLQGSPQTILLSPCIHAATRHLASLSNMVKIVEQCIELAFVTGGAKSHVHDPWSIVLSSVQMPELNLTEFFQACLQESAYLLMFCHVRQQIPLCQSLAEEQGLIEMMLDWTERAKPSIESESKLLLWWYKAVDMIFRQIDCGQQKTVCVQLLRKLMSKVKVFGEDRASEGLLGAIGLGRKSQLSEKFRVCCRALVAFCCNQILGDNTLRLSSQDPVSNLSAAKQDTASLLSIKSNKKYQQIREQVERSCDFVTDQSKCLRDALGLLCMLKGMFYAEKDYLSVILVT